jgi:uncharacterized protein involved in exopolysaccharide biosynthesis
MRRWIRLIGRLYPAHWRRRYGAEFDALLEDASPTWRNAVDVGWNALEMHMNAWSFPKLAVVCGLAGAISAAALAVRMPDKYISEAVLTVSGDEQSTRFFRDRVIQRAFSRNSLSELIQEDDIYATDRQRMPLDDVIERMRHDITITAANSATGDPKNFAFVMRYVYRDPVRAQRTTYELASRIVEANLVEAMRANKSESNAERRSTGTRLQIIVPPSLPRKPAKPNRFLITILGVGAGLALAVLAAVAMRLSRAPAQT